MAIFQNFPDTANQQAQPGPPHVDPMQPAAPQVAPRQLLAQGCSSPGQSGGGQKQQQGGGGGGLGRLAQFGKGAIEGMPEMGGEAAAGGAAAGAGEAAAGAGAGAAAGGGEAAAAGIALLLVPKPVPPFI